MSDTELVEERAALGAVLLDPGRWAELEAALRSDDFVATVHREVYEAMVAISARKVAIDVLSLESELAARGVLKRMEGGAEYLLKLAESAPTAESLTHAAAAVLRRATANRLAMAAAQWAAKAKAPGADAAAIIDEASLALVTLQQRSGARDVARIGDLVPAMLDRFEARQKQGKIVTGVPTGLRKLDRLTGGLQPKNYICIAGRPGQGKTSMAVALAARAAVEGGGWALVFSLEMSRDELLEKWFSQRARIDSEKLRRGEISGADWQRINATAADLSSAALYVDDEAFTLPALRAKALRCRAKHPGPGGVVVIDFVQLVRAVEAQGRGKRESNRSQELAGISQGIKELAKQLDVPVVVVAAMNREIEKRGGDPLLSDLRESGSIESDADVIIFLAPVYEPGANRHAQAIEIDGVKDIICAKHRNGSPGRLRAAWLKETMTFADLATDGEMAGEPTWAERGP